MSIVQQDEYTTPQQEEDKRFTGVNEFGNVISTLGQLGMMGLAMSAGGGFGKNKQTGPKGMGKSRISTTGIPQSQFSPSGMSRNSVASPTGGLGQIGLTRSAKSPYGPLKIRSDPVGDFAKRLGRQAGKAATTTKRAAAGVAKKVKTQYRKLTADPFKGTNVFEGKGPNEMREKSIRRKPPAIKTKGLKPNKKGAPFRTMATIAEESPTTPRSAYKTPMTSTPRSAYKTPMTSTPKSAGGLRVPTAFTQAGYRTK